MDRQKIKDLAKFLDQATLDCREVDRLTLQDPDLSIPDAYLIQDEGVALRLLTRNEKVVGLKMGLTSKAKMKQMGVDSPIYGVLTHAMQIQDSSRMTLKGRIHPKIEPEVAFLLKSDLRGKVTAAQALEACSGVCAAMEIIDSRFKNFNFTLPDVVADNCSSSGFVLGPVIRKPHEVDLGNLGMILEVNGKPVQFGSSSAIYGHPAQSLAELCHMLDARGLYLKAGSIVLAGAATAAISLDPGTTVSTSVQDLGKVTLHVEA